VVLLRVLVIGAGKLGIQVIRQLRKSGDIEIIVADPRERPDAVEEGLIEKVDLRLHVTAMNFEEAIDAVGPDLVLLARTIQDWDKADTPMGTQFVLGMERELTKYDVPVLPVCEEVIGTR
jgi:UDP-N-acetylmuramoylalanine-D-glutamate ligase